MRDHYTYEYAIIRVVPRVEREEFVNAGVILWCASLKFIEARIELDDGRLQAIDPTLDDESIRSIRAHLASIIAICQGGEEAGPIGRLSESERFHWLVAPRSTIIQTSPVHTGRCNNPAAVIERLLQTMVLPPCAESP
ncbi:MAG: DUF3037 domain-containing protein [Blastocatellia bacterium]|nr:DUF3037 domain-containing protein [Blastocatellia bacterium]